MCKFYFFFLGNYFKMKSSKYEIKLAYFTLERVFAVEKNAVVLEKAGTCASVFLPPTEHCRCCGVTLPQSAANADRFHLVWGFNALISH